MRRVTMPRTGAPSRLRLSLASGLIALGALATPAAACRSLDAIVAESLFSIWQAAVASGDIDRLATLYAPDAIVYGPSTRSPATTMPAHRRELAALGALGAMTARMRTVATGCGSIRDYGTLTAKANGALMRYSRVYEMRDGRWLITLEHVSLAEGEGRTRPPLVTAARPQPTAVQPVVAGYLKTLPVRNAQPHAASGVGNSARPAPHPAPHAASPALQASSQAATASGPAHATAGIAVPPAITPPIAKPAKRPRPRWMRDLPGFGTAG